MRWHVRLCLESPTIGLADAQLALATLTALAGTNPSIAAAALGDLCESAGHPDVRSRIAAWLERIGA